MDAYTDKGTMVELLMDSGLGRQNATMAVMYMWFRPATTDPYSPVITTMVAALQRELACMGIHTRGDGYVDRATAKAFDRIVGPRWKNVTWGRVFERVLAAKRAGATKEGTMSYLHGMGAIDVTKWCSDKNPQGRCKPLRNICKPMDVPTADLFKELQRELNRAAAVAKVAPIWVDARPGPETLKLCNKVLGTSFSHCDQLCAKADELVTSLKTWNAAAGAPAVAPEGKAPAISRGKGVDLGPADPGAGPSRAGLVEFFTTPLGMMLVAGGVIFFLATRPKPKKKAKKKKRKARRKPRRRYTYTYY